MLYSTSSCPNVDFPGLKAFGWNIKVRLAATKHDGDSHGKVVMIEKFFLSHRYQSVQGVFTYP